MGPYNDFTSDWIIHTPTGLWDVKFVRGPVCLRRRDTLCETRRYWTECIHQEFESTSSLTGPLEIIRLGVGIFKTSHLVI